jgi:hypothetical protein
MVTQVCITHTPPHEWYRGVRDAALPRGFIHAANRVILERLGFMWRTDGLPPRYFDEVRLLFASRDNILQIRTEYVPSLRGDAVTSPQLHLTIAGVAQQGRARFMHRYFSKPWRSRTHSGQFASPSKVSSAE